MKKINNKWKIILPVLLAVSCLGAFAVGGAAAHWFVQRQNNHNTGNEAKSVAFILDQPGVQYLKLEDAIAQANANTYDFGNEIAPGRDYDLKQYWESHTDVTADDYKGFVGGNDYNLNARKIVVVLPGSNPVITSDLTIEEGVRVVFPTEMPSNWDRKGSSSDPWETLRKSYNYVLRGPSNTDNANAYLNKIVQSDVPGIDSPAIYRKNLLKINEGVTLTLKGTMDIGGVFGYSKQNSQSPTAYTCGEYVEVRLGSNSKLLVSPKDETTQAGELNCYGHIKQESYLNGGVVDIQGKCLAPFTLFDYSGGNDALSRAGATVPGDVMESLTTGQITQDYKMGGNFGISPFNIYNFENIDSFTVSNGGSLTGACLLHVFSQVFTTPIDAIGPANGKGLIFYNDGASVTFQSEETKSFPLNLTYKYNEETVQYKTHNVDISLSGGGGVRNFDISMVMMAYKASVKTSDICLSIPGNFHFTLQNGDYSINQDVRFFPGSSLTIEEDGLCLANSNLLLMPGTNPVGSYPETNVPSSRWPGFKKGSLYYLVDDLSAGLTGGATVTTSTYSSVAKYYVDKNSVRKIYPSTINEEPIDRAKLLVKGTFIATEDFGGFIECGSSNARLELLGDSYATTYEVSGNSSQMLTSNVHDVFALQAVGHIGNEASNTHIESRKSYKGHSTGKYWMSNTANEKYLALGSMLNASSYGYSFTMDDGTTATTYTNELPSDYFLESVTGNTYTFSNITHCFLKVAKADGTIAYYPSEPQYTQVFYTGASFTPTNSSFSVTIDQNTFVEVIPFGIPLRNFVIAPANDWTINTISDPNTDPNPFFDIDVYGDFSVIDPSAGNPLSNPLYLTTDPTATTATGSVETIASTDLFYKYSVHDDDGEPLGYYKFDIGGLVALFNGQAASNNFRVDLKTGMVIKIANGAYIDSMALTGFDKDSLSSSDLAGTNYLYFVGRDSSCRFTPTSDAGILNA